MNDLLNQTHVRRARFRANVFFQQGQVAMALRVIQSRIPSFDDLGLPPALADFCAVR